MSSFYIASHFKDNQYPNLQFFDYLFKNYEISKDEKKINKEILLNDTNIYQYFVDIEKNKTNNIRELKKYLLKSIYFEKFKLLII